MLKNCFNEIKSICYYQKKKIDRDVKLCSNKNLKNNYHVLKFAGTVAGLVDAERRTCCDNLPIISIENRKLNSSLFHSCCKMQTLVRPMKSRSEGEEREKKT